jgi:hypothetical protein
MMEAVRTSETSVDNNFIRQYIPEDNSEQTKVSLYTILVNLNIYCYMMENELLACNCVYKRRWLHQQNPS